MTTIVIGVLIAMVLAGVAVIVRASREAGRGRRVCEHCRNVNPVAAKFCAHCGQALR